MAHEERKRLIVLVTGANGCVPPPSYIYFHGHNGRDSRGVGFGTCHRLLNQLSQCRPPDAQPFFTSVHTSGELPTVEPACDLTIIMACRSIQRAEEARQKLYNLLDTRINKIPVNTPEHEYATRFRLNLRIGIHKLDLATIRSVLDLSKELPQKWVSR